MTWWTNNRVQPKNKSKFVVVFGGMFYLPNIKSLNKPKIDFDTKEFRLLNHKFNYPGNGTWQPITMKFVDMNGLGHNYSVFDTGAFLWQVLNNTGYTYPYVDNSQFRDPHFRNVNAKTAGEFGGGHHISTKLKLDGSNKSWRTITTPEKSSTIANSFGLGLEDVADFKNASTSKQRISIYQLDDGDGISKCWHLINPIVKTIGWGDLDYSSDDPVEYELGVVYDWAIMDRQKLGEKLTLSELPFKHFMKTINLENEKTFIEKQGDVVLEKVPALGTMPENDTVPDLTIQRTPAPRSEASRVFGTSSDLDRGGNITPIGDITETKERTQGVERQVGGTLEIERRGSGGTVDPLPPVTTGDTPNPFSRTTPLGSEE